MAEERRFRLGIGLQLPPGSKGPYIPAGEEVTESQLAGLNVEALLQGMTQEGEPFLKAEPEKLHCPACEETGTKEEAKKTYKDLNALRAHYGKDHPALAAPTQ